MGTAETTPLPASASLPNSASRAEWASVRQVHGRIICRVDEPGPAGEGDGLITNRSGVPLAIATADCVPIIIEGDTSVAVIHAGWRGVAAGVIEAGKSDDGGDR